mmetsp:Transcript_1624/g.3775  ORF Transcript_1624/g.3775 Transcript_1624/m.3775 type:complete len:498 (+) Transcript_1624:259-1752(+)
MMLRTLIRASQERSAANGQIRALSAAIVNDAKLADVERKIKESNIDTIVVGFTDPYGRLMGKRYNSSDFVANVMRSGAHSCKYLFCVDVPMNPLPGFKYANWEAGFGDCHLVPDLDSLTPCAWNPGTAIVQCDVYDVDSHELVPIAPRSILRNQLRRLENLNYNEDKQESQQISVINAASELEHYLFDDTYREAHDKGYSNLKPAGYYSEDYHILQGFRTEPFHREVRLQLEKSGVPVENSKGETGIGQHEVNVRYDEMLRMADRHMIFKQAMKEIAEQQGRSVTFMAKPFADDAGSSCHIHCSIFNNVGKNLFKGTETLDSIKGCSPLFKSFLAGWIQHTPELFAFYAPTINSYKRFRAGSWAPTATAWGKDNRTAGFRVVGSGQALRIECRLPGADVNPYLAFAAAIASGLDGVERGLQPPPILEGDGYKAAAAQTRPVPISLGDASQALRASDFVREVFGEEVQEHYAHFYHLEQQAFDLAVTDWERKRYFEQI